ncbi:cytochrome P450 [Arthrobacter sp. B6]|uniref:cytochrome P450 n=1 Tax=Arthrobacter sp. B6 TaxID=1570137 RepID=UPI00082CC217|nr:cytochrome P450 [Arthrobacter sp. B6]
MSTLPEYRAPRDMRCPFDPPPATMELARKSTVTRVRQWDGIVAWLVTGYEEARAVLSDNEHFSVNPANPGFPEKNAAYTAVMGRDHNLRTMDPPEHGEQKRMLVRDFTVRKVESLRPKMQDLVDELIDEMLDSPQPFEFHHGFALEIPTRIICDLLGVPVEDRNWFTGLSLTATSAGVSVEEAAAAGQDLYDYIDKLLDVKLATPGEDLTSRLVHEQLQAGALSRKDTIELIRFLLIAGHETTANTITLSVLALLQHPDQLEAMKSDPELIPNAVDELLRYLSVAHTGRRRVAIADVMVGDQLIKAGEGVIVGNHIADRDPDQFPEPATLDIRRQNAKTALAFGFGIHQCLGQTLSRVELQVVHSTLWRRVPSLALAKPITELDFVEDRPIIGVDYVPVIWDAGSVQ